MSLKSFIKLISFSTLCGVLTYAYLNEWIIIKNPWKFDNKNTASHHKIRRAPIKLFFWRHNQWEMDTVFLSFPENIQEQSMLIVQSWFHEASQTGFIKHIVSTETVLYDPRYYCLYISLNKSPFDHNVSTRETIAILESFLKTIHDALGKNIQHVQFSINHKILEHPYIDCSQPFPATGFGTFNS